MTKILDGEWNNKSGQIAASVYQLNYIIHKGNKATIYEGCRNYDNQGIMYKTLSAEISSSEQAKILKNEYKLLNLIDAPNVIKVLELIENNSIPIMIMESIEGGSLTNILNRRKITLIEFLRLALSIANGLRSIHQRNIIHKNINTDCILWNEKTGNCKIIDFTMASHTSQENLELGNTGHSHNFDGNLAFMSPEQTGRLNRIIDYRTDYYSTGIVFYKILTNTRPFNTDDVSEMVHSHLAKTPLSPHELDNKIPEVISDIIMKLLAKSPEDRYQSTTGLIYDIEKCLSTIKDDKIKSFKLASHDKAKRFNMPELLYGRKNEITSLFDAFNTCLKGRKKIIFFSGPSGIGKTTIVSEIQNPVTTNNGLIIKGKFDYHKQEHPYNAIIHAFEDFLCGILSESDHKQKEWIHQLKNAIGNNGQILIDLFPSLGQIIGPQQPVPDLAPVESQNRFNHVFQNFVKVFASQKHPLVLYLDDLHWADKASLDLLYILLYEAELHHFLFIGTFRDDEINKSNSIIPMIELLSKDNIDCTYIKVDALNITQTGQLIARALNKNINELTQFTEFVYNKTNGTPFLIKELLRILHASNLIQYTENLRQPESSGWSWNLKDIQTIDNADDVIILIKNKILSFSGEAIKILKFCSCLGTRISLTLLCQISKKTIDDVLEDVEECIHFGLMIHEKNNIYFAHDQILEIVYSMISVNEKIEAHYLIGKELLSLLNEKNNHEKNYDLLYQWNRSKNVLNENEINELIHLNYQAGLNAKKTVAYQASAKFFEQGAEILPNDLWQKEYKFAYLFHKEWAEVEYLDGNFNKAEELFNRTLTKTKSVLEKIEIYAIMIRYYISQTRMDEALEIGINTLNLLGIKIPSKPNQLSVIKEFLRSKAIMGRKKTKDLINLPALQNKRIEAAIEIMGLCMPPALISNPNFVPVLILKVFNLSITNGIAPMSPYIIASYGIILSSALGNIRKGLEFSELAVNLLKKYPSKIARPGTLFVHYVCFMHLKFPFSVRQEYIHNLLEQCLEDGNFEFYGYSLNDYNWSAFFSGKNLGTVRAQLARYQIKVHQIKQPQTSNYYSMFYQGIENLIGKTQNTVELIGDQFNEDSIIPQLKDRNDNAAQTWYKVLKMILHYLLGDHTKGLEYAQECERTIDGLIGLAIIQIYHFFYALLLSSVISEKKFPDKHLLSKLYKIEKKYKKWSLANPENYLNKYLLMRAEITRIEGKNFEETTRLYDEAIKAAASNGFTHEEAIASELAARYFKKLNLSELSIIYIAKAHSGYLKWGSLAKAEYLQKQYPELNFVKTLGDSHIMNGHAVGETFQINLSNMDLNSILKTSYAISQEINLEGVLKKLMKFASENAGAEKGYFLLPKNDEWLIEAAYRADHKDILVMKSIPVIHSDGMPVLSTYILNYVIKTRQIIVLGNALNDDRFNEDLYIQIYKSKSILCLPLLKQGHMIGIIYLENNLLNGCFTSERIDILQMLSGHIALSINNALLYENLDNKVKERTAELEIERNKLQDRNISMEKDITLARKIQLNLIPQKIHVKYISHIYNPMEALGGDFFDIIQFEDSDKIGIFISDVSGHGVTAAFVTSMIKSIIHQSGDKALNPASLLSHMNEVLENMTSGNFVTAFYGIYDPQKSVLLYSNAGHNHPYLISDDGISCISGGKSMALAVLPNDQLQSFKNGYYNSEEKLPIGAKLLIYTDGLTEATPHGRGNFFEGDELNRHILKYKDLPAEEFNLALYTELVTFRGSEFFDDDICFLCMDINPDNLKRTFKYKTKGIEIRRACLDLQALLIDWGIPITDTQDMVLAVDEALTNIKEHGYKGNNGSVDLEISKEKSTIHILIKDNAKPYQIDNIDEIDRTTYVGSDKIGGFGITIIKSLMDAVQLSRKNNQNLLLMSKSVSCQNVFDN